MASDGTTAARLFVEVGARGLNETAAGLGRMDQAVRGSSQGIGGLVRAAGGIYAVKKGFDATIGSAIAWESEFAGVEKTVDGTAAELGALEDELLGMHRTMPVARADLAGIAEAAGALGIGTKDIGEFTETVAMIGETTNVSSDMAANALGKLSNVLGLTVDDYDNFGAALVDLGNKGASTEQEILAIAERAGAGAALIDIAADKTLGWSAAVANLGIEAEAGGSALQRFFLGATEQINTGGKELEIWAQTAGMTAAEFKKAFGEDSSAALQAFITGLGQMSDAQRLATLEALEFNDIRITRTLLGLAGDTENLTDSLNIGADAWKANAALAEEYGKRADTTASRIEVLTNRVGDLGRRMGESQEGPVDWVLTGLEWSVSGWEKAFDDLGEKGAAALTAPFMSPQTQSDMQNALSWLPGAAKPVVDEFVVVFDDATNEMTAAWKERDIGGLIERDMRTTGERFNEQVQAMPEVMSEEMAKAREAAVEGMAAIMDATLNLGSAEDYQAAWEDYLSGSHEVFTDDARSKFIAGQFAGDAFSEGLHSEDSARVEETVSYVNDQLAAYDLMNPGALAIGKEIPANLQAGMEEIYPQVNEYLKERHGETLDTLTLTEAEKLGVDGIWLWWQGMQSEKQNAIDTAFSIRASAAAQLNFDASAGGASVVDTWINGMSWAFWNRYGELLAISAEARNVYGGSLPTKGPLAGGVGSGGKSIVDSWFDAMLGTFYARMGEVESAVGGVGSAFDLGTPSMDFNGAGSSAGGTVEYHTHIELTVEGDLKADDEESVVATLQRTAPLLDMRLGR